MDKKGLVIELIAFVIIGIMTVGFFAVFIYGFNLVHTNMASINLNTNLTNFTYAEESTFGKLNIAFGNLRLIAFVIIFAYIISIFIVAYFSTKHPIWIGVYVLITILVTIFSVYISNAWETMKADALLGTTFESFTMSDFIISRLPYFVVVISLFGIMISIVGTIIARRYSEA